MTEHSAILLFFVVTLGLAVAMMLLAVLLGPKRRHAAKFTTYECGVEPRDSGAIMEERVPVKYATVALIFIIFDVEAAFFLPWAVIFRAQLKANPVASLAFIGFFALMLLLGLLYAYQRHVFEWDE